VKPGDKPAGAAPATVAQTVQPEPATEVQQPGGGNYSTDNDVSKLMGDKGAVHAKVSVYHGNTAEQLDFNQGRPNEGNVHTDR
jgi:hypothetical protein